MNDEPRLLTPAEVESIVSQLDPGLAFDTEIHQSITEAHRENIRRQLVKTKIRPSKLARLAKEIQTQYRRAIVKPGALRGLVSAHSVVQPIYQASLNAFHAAGSLLKISDIIKLINVIINANKSIPFAISTINVNQLLSDVELYIKLRQDLLEVRFKDLKIDTEIYNFGEAGDIIQQHTQYYRHVDHWYPNQPYLDPENALMHIELDRHLLYIKRLTPYRLAQFLVQARYQQNQQVYIFPSPVTIDKPFIDIIIPKSIIMNVQGEVQKVAKSAATDTIGTQNAAVLFFNTIIVPSWDEAIVAGVPGVHEVSVQKINFGNAIIEQELVSLDQGAEQASGNIPESVGQQYRVKVRSYHFHNKLVKVPEIFRLYFPDVRVVGDHHGFQTLELTSDQDPKVVMGQRPYTYGLVKSYQNKTNTYTTVDFNYLIDYDYIIPERCGTTNFYYIRDRFGIQACQNNVVHSFTNIITDQSPNTYPENAVLIASYICVKGDLVPYTFAGYSRHEVGPIASAFFQNPFDAIAKSLNYQQPTTSIDAAIVAGVRPPIGTQYVSRQRELPEPKVDFQEVAQELIGQRPPSSQPAPPPTSGKVETAPETVTTTAPPKRLGRLAIRTVGGGGTGATPPATPTPSTALQRATKSLSVGWAPVLETVQPASMLMQVTTSLMSRTVVYRSKPEPLSQLMMFFDSTVEHHQGNSSPTNDTQGTPSDVA